VATPIPILHQDERLLVVAKPAGLLSVGDRSRGERGLPEALRAQGLEAAPVHRLDRDVSGVVVLSRDPEAQATLEALFRERAVAKTYWAMAQGRYQEERGTYRWPIAEVGRAARVSSTGRPAETRWRVLARHPAATEVEIDLVTGRRNQIRVHFAHAGHPLVGERVYARGRDQKLRFKSRRVALHAWRVAFEHPFGGGRVEVEAPLPEDLVQLRREAAATP
jgi:23S rRNA pseudouridine1911/1915/1917 synthase